MKPFSAAALLILVSLTGCGTSPDAPPEAGPPKAELQFIDLPGFDKALNGSLDAALPRVGVDFYDQVAPSALPERLQSWLAAVETGGGIDREGCKPQT